MHFLGRWSDRLQELGSHYGAFPAHDGLWDSASETAHSLLARLAIVHMVHEARGLDVYTMSRNRLIKANDTSSCEILEKNHVEEITHVGAAVRWFKYLCDRENIEVDPVSRFHEIVRTYFRGTLKAPFNKESRDKAQLFEEWYMPLTMRVEPQN